MTTSENDVFRKIKEISSRAMNPRPTININDIAGELSVTDAMLLPWLARLKQLKLIAYSETTPSAIKLTLLGTVVAK
jgi:predicted transcriptional regulator